MHTKKHPALCVSLCLALAGLVALSPSPAALAQQQNPFSRKELKEMGSFLSTFIVQGFSHFNREEMQNDTDALVDFGIMYNWYASSGGNHL